jgi:hypothetical protein
LPKTSIQPEGLRSFSATASASRLWMSKLFPL